MRMTRNMTCRVLGVVLVLAVGASASRPLVLGGSESHVATDADLDLNQLDFDAFVVRSASACNRQPPTTRTEGGGDDD
jgi:hypothetical protein